MAVPPPCCHWVLCVFNSGHFGGISLYCPLPLPVCLLLVFLLWNLFSFPPPFPRLRYLFVNMGLFMHCTHSSFVKCRYKTHPCCSLPSCGPWSWLSDKSMTFWLSLMLIFFSIDGLRFYILLRINLLFYILPNFPSGFLLEIFWF